MSEDKKEIILGIFSAFILLAIVAAAVAGFIIVSEDCNKKGGEVIQTVYGSVVCVQEVK